MKTKINVVGNFAFIHADSLTPDDLYEAAKVFKSHVETGHSTTGAPFVFLAAKELFGMEPISHIDFEEALERFFTPENLKEGADPDEAPVEIREVVDAMVHGYSGTVPRIPLIGMIRRAQEGGGPGLEKVKQLLSKLPPEIAKHILEKMAKEGIDLRRLADIDIGDLGGATKVEISLNEEVEDEDEDEDEDEEYKDSEYEDCLELLGPMLVVRAPSMDLAKSLFGAVMADLDPKLFLIFGADGHALGGDREVQSMVNKWDRLDLKWDEIEKAIRDHEGEAKASDAELVEDFLKEANWL
jgi:hypothetical protein